MPSRVTSAVANDRTSRWRLDRRDFLRASTALLAGLAARGVAGHVRPAAREDQRRTRLRFGLLTDPHYADADPVGRRFYRESLAKVREAVDRLRAERVEFLAELGDLKDMAPGESDTRTLVHLSTVSREIRRFGGPTYHVLGNHDMDNLSKAQFLAGVVNTGIPRGRAFYAFRRSGVRFIVLDACAMTDGRAYDHGNFDWRDTVVPAPQLDWLQRELAASTDPVVLFVHQRLDGTGDPHVKNSPEVRAILEASGRVIAAFHGHEHAGGHSIIQGIHYYTLRAVVEGSGPENNAYAVVDVHDDLSLTVSGYRRAVTMELTHAARA